MGSLLRLVRETSGMFLEVVIQRIQLGTELKRVSLEHKIFAEPIRVQ